MLRLARQLLSTGPDAADRIRRIDAEATDRIVAARSFALDSAYPDPATALAFTVYGLACVAVAGVFGALTVMRRILYIQTVPALLALGALYLARS